MGKHPATKWTKPTAANGHHSKIKRSSGAQGSHIAKMRAVKRKSKG